MSPLTSIRTGGPRNGRREDGHGRSVLFLNALIRIRRTTDEMTTRELRDVIVISPAFCNFGSLRGTMFERELGQSPVYSRRQEGPTDAWHGKDDH